MQLAQHIKDYHPHISKNERLVLTSNAKRVGQAPRPEVSHKQGMPTIDAYFRTQKEREEQPPNLAVLPVVATKGTRSDPCFPPSHSEMKKHNEYLRSYDGERKSEREAEAIATDVSKFLRYASEKVDWLHISNPQKVRSYLEYLEKKAAYGVDGCLTKLQRISKALSYVTQELYPNNEKLYFRCQQVAERTGNLLLLLFCLHLRESCLTASSYLGNSI